MIYIKSFKNYEEFKNVFGIRECGNGNKARMNKILLGCLKDKEFFHLCCKEYPSYLEIDNMADFKNLLLEDLEKSSYKTARNGDRFPWTFKIGGNSYQFWLPQFMCDNDGVCYDGDVKSIRYYNYERAKFFKMKAGKFMNFIIDTCQFGWTLPQQARSWLGEEFLTSWQSFASRHSVVKNYEFHYGSGMEDFEEIYSSDHMRGNFHSCMTDEGNHPMYYRSVKAHAAWLTDADGWMFARCVIFDEVYDETAGKTLRLAERQYSDGVQDCFKKQLVDELIARGLIDGYKQIGASCHDNRAFVLNDGTSISGHNLSIDCEIDNGDPVSYMDSFVYYNPREQKAYNSEFTGAIELDVTGGEIDIHANGEWSDYNDEYIDRDDACYVASRDDYFWEDQVVCDVNGDYQLEEDCVRCDNCGEFILIEDAYRIRDSHLDAYYFCDEECAESWLKAHGYSWDEYNKCYTNEDTYTVNIYRSFGWTEYDMAESTFNDFDFEHEIHELDGKYYLTNDDKSKEAYKNMTLPALVVA